MKGCQTHTRYAVIVLCVIHGCYEAVHYLVVTFECCYCLHNYISETIATLKSYVSHVLSLPCSLYFLCMSKQVSLYVLFVTHACYVTLLYIYMYVHYSVMNPFLSHYYIVFRNWFCMASCSYICMYVCMCIYICQDGGAVGFVDFTKLSFALSSLA